MRYRNFVVTAKSEGTQRTFSDTFYCTSEGAARRDFREVYRHGDYTIIDVKLKDGELSDAELKILAEIASKHISALQGRDNLEPQNMDELDFFETSVWDLEAALAAAYHAGLAEAKKEQSE